MSALIVLSLLITVAVAATLIWGWRDGWLTPRGFVGHDAPEIPAPSRRTHNYAAVAEVMKFAAVRRRIGYRAANEIMRALAERIAADPRMEIGRVGRTSIEFFYRADDPDDAMATMQALRGALQQAVTVDAMPFAPEVAIGSNRIAVGETGDELFEISALAVEDAQRKTERISFARAGDFGASAASARMLPDLIEAINEDRLELHYMPKLSLADETVTAAEALCRWTHPRHGNVPPMTFVGLAEETGLIDELTIWTLDRAIADQRRLLEQDLVLPIDVNLSGRLVSDAGFCDLVIARIADAPGKIGLEITETAVIEDTDAALANLRRIADAGIHLAIDDFGSGLSSLSYLRDLPAHELKIDQAFVRSLTTSHRDPLLVRSAIEIARALEMEVTAEGVEDELALSLLTIMRCDHVQGYHISQPLPLPQLVEYLKSGSKPVKNELTELQNRLGTRRVAN
jgi:EAL domain-containing protein (putative c-di-GMP-specific phosphodiesterase class I)/GGDEF domain-containing protein